MTARAWSLRSRVAVAFALTVSLYLALAGLALTLVYAWVIAGELDEELIEQLEVLQVPLDVDDDELLAILSPSSAAELETPLAFEVTLENPLRTLTAGSTELLAEAAAFDGLAVGEVKRPTRTTRLVRWEFAPGVTARVILDGREWLDRVRWFAASMAVVAVLGSLLSLAVGRLFGRRVSRLVSAVADRVERRGEMTDARLAVEGDPEEVRAVAAAMESRLRLNRAEIERSQILSAGLAHDLRAPIQLLLTSTQVAADQARKGDELSALELQPLLEGHMGELRALGRTVDNIVEWGAPRYVSGEEGRVGALRFDLAEELRDRLKAEEEEAARAGVFFDRTFSGDLTLNGSPDAVVLAIRNLVGNAIAWCATGGEVSLRVSAHQGAITVQVDDEGPGFGGIDPATLFEPFVRGEAAPGRRAGYGLGLAIVRAVAERHGGSAHAANRTDEDSGAILGARLTLELPA